MKITKKQLQEMVKEAVMKVMEKDEKPVAEEVKTESVKKLSVEQLKEMIVKHIMAKGKN